MSSDEGFFVRWARRKRSVARLSSADGRVSEVSDVTPPESTQPLSDPVSLPAVESIDAAADVRAFLAPGVPAELTRAALRRAWSADPAIRDFIGLSENSWDFNVPGAMGGFGSLTIED